MFNPRVILLVLLVVAGLGFGARLMLAPGDAVQTAPRLERVVAAVVVTRHALLPGRLLRPDDLATLPWPGATPPAAAILVGSPAASALTGAVTRRAFAAGEFVVAGSVIAPGEHGFLAAIVAPGRRAIAISVDATTSASGLIWPGDRVDIILTQEIHEDSLPLGKRVVSETILGDVRILSTDQKLDTAGDADAGVEGKLEPRRVPATITVEVTPAQAERVTVGATLGRLHLTLRGIAAGDAGVGPVPPTWAGGVSPALASVPVKPRDVVGPARPAAPAAPTVREPRGVRIYRGSQGVS